MTVQRAISWIGYAARISVEDAKRWVVAAGFDRGQLLSVGLLLESSPMVNLPKPTGKLVQYRCVECSVLHEYVQKTNARIYCPGSACRQAAYRRRRRGLVLSFS